MRVEIEVPKGVAYEPPKSTLSFDLEDADAVLFWLESNAAELRKFTRPEWETETTFGPNEEVE